MTSNQHSTQGDIAEVRSCLRANGVLRYGRFERDNTYGALHALTRLEEQLETYRATLERIAYHTSSTHHAWSLARRALPQPDTDPHRLADPDGVGYSEVERCNEQSPDGEMLCDREPGHEGAHVNWRGTEWKASSPALDPVEFVDEEYGRLREQLEASERERHDLLEQARADYRNLNTLDGESVRLNRENRELKEQLETAQSIIADAESLIRYLRPDLDASRDRADRQIKRMEQFWRDSIPASEPKS